MHDVYTLLDATSYDKVSFRYRMFSDTKNVDVIILKLEQNDFTIQKFVGWLVGCFRLNGPLRQYFSLYRAVSLREGERKEK